jgi:acyl dehydratase
MNTKTNSPASAFDDETLRQGGFPQIAFDTLEIGETFRSDDRLIRPQDVEAYAYAVDDYDPWFFSSNPLGKPIAHPTILANQALMMRHSRYVVPAGLHARMMFEFLAPIELGVRARTLGRVVDKYIRRDKPYMVTEFSTQSEDGVALVRGQFVQMLFKSDKAPSAGSAERPTSAPPTFDVDIQEARGRHGAIRVGEQLPMLERTPEQRQIDVYSGVKPLSIHTDVDWARAKGLRTTIAQGMMSTAYVSTMMTGLIGVGFVRGGQMDAKFLRPVYCDDTLTLTGAIDGFTKEAGSLRVHAHIAAHNSAGERTLAATASGLCN